MFEVYAAQIEYQHVAERREHDLAIRAQRLARVERSAPPVPRRARRAPVAWPRPITLHATAPAGRLVTSPRHA